MAKVSLTHSTSLLLQMGLQGGATTIALFLMVLATFAVAVGALSLAVTVGKEALHWGL